MLSDDRDEDAAIFAPMVVSRRGRGSVVRGPTRALVEVATRVEISVTPGGVTLMVVSVVCRPAVSVSIVTVEVPPVTLFICVVWVTDAPLSPVEIICPFETVTEPVSVTDSLTE